MHLWKTLFNPLHLKYLAEKHINAGGESSKRADGQKLKLSVKFGHKWPKTETECQVWTQMLRSTLKDSFCDGD